MSNTEKVNTMLLCAGILLFFPVLSRGQDAGQAGNADDRGGISASATIPETEYNTPERARGQAQAGTVSDAAQAVNDTGVSQGVE